MRQLLSAIGLFILLGYTAASQPRDLKLSPPEPTTYALPDSLRIQAADAYGPNQIVVWGSNRRLADSTLVTCVWAQIYRDSIKVGNPFIVHSDAARPSWALSVCVNDGRFLVAWNDARVGSPGVYYTLLDSLGTSLGEERRIPDMENDGYFFRVLPSSTSSFVIVVSTMQPPVRRFFAQTIAANGELVDGLKQIGPISSKYESQVPLISFAEGIDGWLMKLNEIWFAVGRRLDSVREVTMPICGHFVIRDDGGVVIVCGDSVRRYASLFDRVPLAVAHIPLIDELKVLGVAPAASGDSLMLFGVIHVDSGITIHERFIRIQLSSALAMTGADTLSKIRIGPYMALTHDATVAARVCSSGVRITPRYVYTERGYHDRLEDRAMSRVFHIDSHGRSAVGGAELVPCEPAKTIRLTSDVVSSILFLGDTLSAPTSKVILNTPQRAPVIDVSNDSIRVAWFEPTTGYYALRRWISIADTATSLVAAMRTAQIETMQSYTVSNYVAIEKTYASYGRAAVTAHHEQDEFWRGIGDRYASNENFSYSLYTPRDSVWVRTFLMAAGAYSMGATLWSGPISFDPRSRTVTGSFSYDGPVVFAIDDRGTKVDSIRASASVVAGSWVLYDGPKQYLIVDRNEVRSLNRDAHVSISRFPTIATTARIHRLNGRQFLRMWRDAANMRNLIIERYDFEGRPEGNTTLELHSTAGQFDVAEGRDGRLYVVHADTGVYAYVLAPYLNTATGRMRISSDDSRAQNPNALVYHDSLIVVWEDERNEGFDVYGVAVSIDDVRARIESPRSTATTIIAMTSPQPAQDYIDVALTSTSSSTLNVSLFDINSRVCTSAQIAPAAQSTRLDVRACASGVYLLEVRSVEHREQRRLVIVR